MTLGSMSVPACKFPHLTVRNPPLPLRVNCYARLVLCKKSGFLHSKSISLASFVLLIIRGFAKDFAKDIEATIAVCLEVWKRLAKRIHRNGRSKA